MNERTRYARPESEGRCHCTELRKASRRISQLYDTALAPSGLKTTQRAILAEIGRSEPTTVGALASRCDPVQARQAERCSGHGLNKPGRMETKLEKTQWTIDISAVPASAFRH